MAYYCYMVECADGSFYTGWTTDPARRERQHNRGVGARYTRTHGPVKLVYLEPVPDHSSALKRERALKALSHAKKKALAESENLGTLPQRHGPPPGRGTEQTVHE